MTKLYSKKFVKQRIIKDLEQQMTEIRMIHSLSKMDINTVLMDGDEMFANGFSPWARFTESIKDDLEIPDEIRKGLNLPKAEMPSVASPITDAESSRQYTSMTDI